jgi:hypothetical protein
MKRSLSGAVINISMRSPHEPARYARMWRKAFQLQRRIKVWSDYAALIGSARPSEEAPHILQGDFYKFLDLELVRDWFNTQTNKVAEDQDLESISIPDHLKPHFVYVPYWFDTVRHQIFFVTKDGQDAFSAKLVQKFLSTLFVDARIVDEYKGIAVNLEPDRGTLARIFGMRKINQLVIDLTNPPNPGDDLSDAEREALERIQMESLENQNLSSATTILRGEPEGGVKPDRNTRALAQIAQSNGKVEATGYELGTKRAVTVSTTERPLEESIVYNPEKEPRGTAFSQLVGRLMRKLDSEGTASQR